jgi:ketol-acid reductoisomerase
MTASSGGSFIMAPPGKFYSFLSYIVSSLLLTIVSQYGQLKGSFEIDTSDMRKSFLQVANERILNGDFAKEFTSLDKDGPSVQKHLEELYEKASHSELAQR